MSTWRHLAIAAVCASGRSIGLREYLPLGYGRSDPGDGRDYAGKMGAAE